jgi:hypothetical protein
MALANLFPKRGRNTKASPFAIHRLEKETLMPLYLTDTDVLPELAGARAVLIVPCRMCPATSLSLREKEPFFELFKTFLRSPALEQHIKTLQARIEERGITTSVYIPRQFLACTWTPAERKRLLNRATEYDTVIVLGCDSATESVCNALQSTACKVIQGMEVDGIVNVKIRFHFPGTVSLEDSKVIPLPPKKNDTSIRGLGPAQLRT